MERKKEHIHVRCKASVLKELQAASMGTGKSQADIVEAALLTYFDVHFKELVKA